METPSTTSSTPGSATEAFQAVFKGTGPGPFDEILREVFEDPAMGKEIFQDTGLKITVEREKKLITPKNAVLLGIVTLAACVIAYKATTGDAGQVATDVFDGMVKGGTTGAMIGAVAGGIVAGAGAGLVGKASGGSFASSAAVGAGVGAAMGCVTGALYGTAFGGLIGGAMSDHMLADNDVGG